MRPGLMQEVAWLTTLEVIFIRFEDLNSATPRALQYYSEGLARSAYPGDAFDQNNLEEVESFQRATHHRRMPQSLSNILVHTIFSTQDRQPFFAEAALRAELHRYVGGILTNLKSPSLLVGGADDHVHLFHRLPRTEDAASVIKEVKRGTSVWLKTKGPALARFSWQSGYGIFSVGVSEIEATRKYIENQEEHNRTLSFQDELRQFLKVHCVEYDERYLWD